MNKLEQTYHFELTYDNVDFTVEEVLLKVKSWRNKFWWDKVSYLISEEITWILGIFSIKNKKLTIYITWWRHSSILCNILWIEFHKDKIKYQKDLFKLNFL